MPGQRGCFLGGCHSITQGVLRLCARVHFTSNAGQPLSSVLSLHFGQEKISIPVVMNTAHVLGDIIAMLVVSVKCIPTAKGDQRNITK